MLGSSLKLDMSTFCVVLVILLLQVVEGTNKFAVPFEIDPATGNSIYGDVRVANLDDEATKVVFDADFPFEDKKYKDFYFSPNGYVSTETWTEVGYAQYESNWADVAANHILFFHQDVKMDPSTCPKEQSGCGVYYRKGDALTTKTIKEIFKSVRLGKDSSIPASFEPDPARTLVVTWYRVQPFNSDNLPGKSYPADKLPRNTFQGVLTSDGTISYAIYSFIDLQYPRRRSGDRTFKAGVRFGAASRKYCQLPVDYPKPRPFNDKVDELLCQTNAYGYTGVFVVGLTTNSGPTCDNLKTNSKGATDFFVDATCASCQSTLVNSRVNEDCSSSTEKPVCGTNDVTYRSMCELRQAACTNSSITLLEDKACYRSPCLTNNGGCSDICKVSPTNRDLVQCSCYNGLPLRADGKTCDMKGFFYVGDADGFSMGKNFNMTMKVPTSSGDQPKNAILAMAHDMASNTMFYAHYNTTANASIVMAFRAPYRYNYIHWVHGHVHKMIYDTKHKHLIVSNDHETGKLAVIKNVKNYDNMADYEKNAVLEVYNANFKFDAINDMVLEPCSGKLFVAGVVERGHHIYLVDQTMESLDKAVVLKNVMNVSALALDTKNHKMYWFSNHRSNMAAGFGQSNLDGSCRVNIVNHWNVDKVLKGLDMNPKERVHPEKMVFDDGSLYWIDNTPGRHRVIKMEPEAELIKVVMTHKQKISAIGFLMPEGKFQDPVCPVKHTCNDPCGIKNGGCADICDSYLSHRENKKYARCSCKGGRELKSDGRSCDRSGSIMIGGLNGFVVGMPDKFGPIVPIHTYKATAMAVDASSNDGVVALEWTNAQGNQYGIGHFNLDFKMQPEMMMNVSARIDGFSYDPHADAMHVIQDGKLTKINDFYTDSRKMDVNATWMHPTAKVVAFDRQRCSQHFGLIYMLIRHQNNHGSICTFDPRDPKDKNSNLKYNCFIEKIKNPRGFAMDHHNHNLYWSSDAGIEESKFDGSCRRKVHDHSKVNQMVYHKGSLFFIDGEVKDDQMYKAFQLTRIQNSNPSVKEIFKVRSQLLSIGAVMPLSAWEKNTTDLVSGHLDLSRLQHFTIKTPDEDNAYSRFRSDFKISFKFKPRVKGPEKTIFEMGMFQGDMKMRNTDSNGRGPGVYYTNMGGPTDGLRIMFSDTIFVHIKDVEVDKMHAVTMGVERIGGFIRFYAMVDSPGVGKRYKIFRMEGNEVPRGNAPPDTEFSKATSWFIRRHPNADKVFPGEIEGLHFHRKVRTSTCPISKKCNVRCTADPSHNACEDECISGGAHPDRCQCNGGMQPMKADHVTCDWSNYIYGAYESKDSSFRGIWLNKDNHTAVIDLSSLGYIYNVEHDIQNNRFFVFYDAGTHQNVSVVYADRTKPMEHIHQVVKTGAMKKMQYLDYDGKNSLVMASENTLVNIVNPGHEEQKEHSTTTVKDVIGLARNPCNKDIYTMEVDLSVVSDAPPVTIRKYTTNANGSLTADAAADYPVTGVAVTASLVLNPLEQKLLWRATDKDSSTTSLFEINIDHVSRACNRSFLANATATQVDAFMNGPLYMFGTSEGDVKYVHVVNGMKGSYPSETNNTSLNSLGIVYDKAKTNDCKSRCAGQCSERNGGCDGECHTMAGQAMCSCPFGKLEDGDGETSGRRCDYAGYTMQAANNKIKFIHGDKNMRDFENEVETGNTTVTAVTFDHMQNKVYYASHGTNGVELKMYNMGPGNSSTLKPEVLAMPAGQKLMEPVTRLSYDEANHDLYFQAGQVIAVFRDIFKGSPKYQLIYNGSLPVYGIAAEPCQRSVFLLHRDVNHNFSLSVYDRATDNLTRLRENLHYAQALTIDTTARRLYFFMDKQIYEVDYLGKCMRKVSAEEEHGAAHWWKESNIRVKSLVVSNKGDYMMWQDNQGVMGLGLEMDDYMSTYGNRTDMPKQYGIVATKMTTGKSSINRELVLSMKVQAFDVIRDRGIKAVKKACEARRDAPPVCSKCVYNIGLGPGGCESRCVPHHGVMKPKCTCIHGKLASDGKRCDFTGYGIYAGDGWLSIQNEDSSDRIIHTISGQAHGVEFDMDNNVVFYSVVKEEKGKTVSKIVGLDTRGKTTVYYKSHERIERLAFDMKSKNLYFTTPTKLNVLRKVYGKKEIVRTLASYGRTSGLAFDPCKNEVFVTCTTSNALYAFDVMKKTQRTVLSDLETPHALGINHGMHKLYFFEDNRVTETSYDGKCHGTITEIDSSKVDPYDIQIGDNEIWFTDKTKHHDGYYLWKIDLKTGAMIKVHNDSMRINGFKWIWDRKMLTGRDFCDYAQKVSCAIGGCRVNNGGCEQQCIPLDKHSKTRCECNHGVLRSDMKTCEYGNYFAFGGDRKHYFSDFSKKRPMMKEEIRGIKKNHSSEYMVTAMEYRYKDNTIFYALHERGSKFVELRMSKNREHTVLMRHVVNSPRDVISFLAYGQSGRGERIYWASPRTFGYFDMTDKKSRVVKDNSPAEHYTGLAKDGCDRRLFVLKDNSLMEWAIITNKWKKLLDLEDARGLSIDIVDHKLYWFSKTGSHGMKNASICNSNYDGSCKKVLSRDISEKQFDQAKYAAVVNQDKGLFWTYKENKKSVLLRYCFKSGKISENRETDEPLHHPFVHIINRNLIGVCPVLHTKDAQCPEQTDCRLLACQELCIDGPGKARCGCRHGAKLQADGRTCSYNHLLYSASGRYIMMHEINQGAPSFSKVFAYAPNHIMAISHSPLTPMVFYAYREYRPDFKGPLVIASMSTRVNILWTECVDELEHSKCSEYKSQGACTHPTHMKDMEKGCRKTCGKCAVGTTGNYGDIQSMAFDWEKNFIYFAGSNGGLFVNGMNMGQAAHATEIELSYCGRNLVWIDVTNNFGKVMKIKDVEHSTSDMITYGYGHLKGLTIDRKRNVLYWYDMASRTLQESRSDFTCQRELRPTSYNRIVTQAYMNGRIWQVEKDIENMIWEVNLHDHGFNKAMSTDEPIRILKHMYTDDSITPNLEYVKGPDGMFYKYFPKSFSSKGAQDKCKEEGASMVMYESKEVHEFLKKRFGYFWIGASDKDVEGTWMWGDKPVKNSHWAFGQPASRKSTDDCALFVHGQWRDACCTTFLAPVVCQRKEPLPEETLYKCMDSPYSVGNCPQWKKWGLCESEAETMKTQCKKTCGYCDVCQDMPEHKMDCAVWKSQGVCESEKASMKVACEKTCGFCGKNPNCFDSPDYGKDCAKWKAEGFCTSEDKTMQNHAHYVCRQTCGLCDVCEDREPPETCAMWKAGGACMDPKHAVNMTLACYKTCGYCDSSAAAKEPECKDIDQKCEQRKDQCQMPDHKENLKKVCYMTCGYCEDKAKMKGEETIERNLDNPNCFDAPDYTCKLYETQGACHALTENKTLAQEMHYVCRSTCNLCNVCEDREKPSTCAMWKSQGACTDPNHQLNMTLACYKTCGFCQDKPADAIKGCTDHSYSNGQCEKWKKEGKCKTDPNMKFMCQKTCDMCKNCEDNSQSMGQCAVWKKQGICTQQAKHMKYMCPKTCDMCASVVPEHTKYAKAPDGNHYKFVTKAMTWHEAKDHCEAEGAKLARTDTAEIIQHLMKREGRKAGFWIGVNDVMNEGIWTNSDNYPIVSTHWAHGQPDNGGDGKDEDCVQVSTDGKWYDEKCRDKKQFVCQKKGFIQGTDGRQYSFHLHPVTFKDAQKLCALEGAHLAYIDNDKTREFLGRQFASRKDPQKPAMIWIGGEDKDSNNKWSWLNGQPIREKYWAQNEPNNYMGVRENCLSSFVDYPAHFYDAPCEEKLVVLCQKSVQSDGVQRVEVAQLAAMMKKNNVRLIDVRPREMVKAGRIAYARNVPMAELKEALELSNDEFRAKYDMEKPHRGDCNLVFYCGVGEASLQAAKIAKEAGFRCHKTLVGGYNDWKKAGYEVNDFERGSDGMLYKYNAGPVSWYQAKKACEGMGAHLAVVRHQKTLAFLQHKFTQMKQDGHVWLGGEYKMEMGDKTWKKHWMWLSGDKVVMEFGKANNFWSPGEPNNWEGRLENCMVTSKSANGHLMDAACDWVGPGYMCQKEMPPMPRFDAEAKPGVMKKRQIPRGYMQGTDGHHYKLVHNKMTFNDAEKHCEGDGGSLAVAVRDSDVFLTYAELNKFARLTESAGRNGLWFWGNDDDKASKFDDGQRVYETDEKCLLFLPTGKFSNGDWKKSEPCSTKRPFLCQIHGSPAGCGISQRCPPAVMYPFGERVGDRMVPKGDNESGHLHFAKGFPFFSRLKSDIYINTNGHMTADKPVKHLKVEDIDVSMGAGYFMDLSTEHGGEIFYRVTNAPKILDRIAFESSMIMDHKGYHKFPKGYKPTTAIIATWYNVRNKNFPERKLTFQVIAHTDYRAVGYLTIFTRLDGHGGVHGFVDLGCRKEMHTSDITVPYEKGSGVGGLRGVWGNRLDLDKCRMGKMSDQPIQVKWKESQQEQNTYQPFYYNGMNKITQVFARSYSGSYASHPIITKVTHELDEARVHYTYDVNAMKDYFKHGSVSIMAIRDDLNNTADTQAGSFKMAVMSGKVNCVKHEFEVPTIIRSPKVILGATVDRRAGRLDGLTNVWLRKVTKTDMTVCSKGMVSFWGPNQIDVHYLVLGNQDRQQIVSHIEQDFTRTFDAMNPVQMKMWERSRSMTDKMEDDKPKMPELREDQMDASAKMQKLKEEAMKRGAEIDNGVFCAAKEYSNNFKFKSAPAVFVTAESSPEAQQANDDNVFAWVKDIKQKYMTICARYETDPAKFGRQYKAKIHIVVVGELDPVCYYDFCGRLKTCYTDPKGAAKCRCPPETCEHDRPLERCASNLHTYKSYCEMKQYMCKMGFTDDEADKMTSPYALYYEPCKQFPYQTGQTQLEPVDEVSVAFCKHISLDSTNFVDVPKDPVRVLLTVIWNNQTEAMPHEATAAWSEDVTRSGFKACVMVAGRHFFKDNAISTPPSVEWVAFQSGVAGSTDDLEVGTVALKTWYSGSRCQTIKLNTKKYSANTKILVSVEHSLRRSFQNAMTSWVERNGPAGGYHICKICARELQNFDGVHKGIKIHYMAIHDAVRPYVTEANAIHFPKQAFTKDQAIPPICKTVMFNHDFPRMSKPVVQITAVNTHNDVLNSPFSAYDISVWLESHNDTHLTACFKSLRAGMHREEVNIQYTIFPTLCSMGWKYHNGQCYDIRERYNVTMDGRHAAGNCSAIEGAHLPVYDHREGTLHFLHNNMPPNTEFIWYHDPTRNVSLGECAKVSVKRGGGNPLYKGAYDNNVTCDSAQLPFTCQKASNLLEEGCHCENNGTCVRADDGKDESYFAKPHCLCKPGFMGKRCEQVFKFKETHCDKYYKYESQFADETSFHAGRWYRFPGYEIMNYCSAMRSGCVSIAGDMPGEGKMTSHSLKSTSYKSFNYGPGYCQVDNMAGQVHVQNCGNFYIYKFDKKIKHGSRFCLREFPAKKKEADPKNQVSSSNMNNERDNGQVMNPASAMTNMNNNRGY